MNEWSKAIQQVNGRASRPHTFQTPAGPASPGTTQRVGDMAAKTRGSISVFRMDLRINLGHLFKNKQKNNHKSACIDFHMCERELILNIGLYAEAGKEEKKQSGNTDMSLLEKRLRLHLSQ